MISEFRFNKAEHTYTLGGRRLPSVTEVLQSVGLIEISPFSTGPALGIRVHEACELEALRMPSAVVLDTEPYVSAYRKFVADTGFKPILIEYSIYHPQHLYAGTLDQYGDLDGKNVLLDIFTGVDARPKRVQLVAYREALMSTGYQSFESFTLHLKKTGKYKLSIVDPFDVGRYWNIFQCALNIHNFKK